MPPPPTKPGPGPEDGFPELLATARRVVLPSGITSTGWPAVRDTAARFGVTFDPWQDGAGRIILAKRADGTYASSIGGAVLSIPRQVGKTFLVGAVAFALCLLNPGLTVLWTAHHTDTSGETFSKMQSFAARKKVRGHVKQIRLDERTILFHNGSRIMFGARERGFGRGFDDVDVVVFDEAQILTERAIDDMVPATNTAANPLLLFVGTPPKPTDPSEVFTAKRDAALEGDDDAAYIEFSADRGCDPMDRSQWRKANPSYPSRTNAASMLRLKKNLTPESFLREGLGIWDEVGRSIIDPTRWAALHDVEGDRPDPVVFGLSSSPDRKWTTLGLAGRRADGHAFLQPIQSGRGTEWVPERVEALVDRWGRITVAIPGDDQAASLKDQIASRKVTVKTLTAREMSQACAMFVRGVEEETIRHSGAQQLAVSLGVARKRTVGRDGWVFAGTETSDVAPLNAVVAPLYVLETSPQKRRSGVVYV